MADFGAKLVRYVLASDAIPRTNTESLQCLKLISWYILQEPFRLKVPSVGPVLRAVVH